MPRRRERHSIVSFWKGDDNGKGHFFPDDATLFHDKQCDVFVSAMSCLWCFVPEKQKQSLWSVTIILNIDTVEWLPLSLVTAGSRQQAAVSVYGKESARVERKVDRYMQRIKETTWGTLVNPCKCMFGVYCEKGNDNPRNVSRNTSIWLVYRVFLSCIVTCI